jgi:hypothetical protein
MDPTPRTVKIAQDRSRDDSTEEVVYESPLRIAHEYLTDIDRTAMGYPPESQ